MLTSTVIMLGLVGGWLAVVLQFPSLGEEQRAALARWPSSPAVLRAQFEALGAFEAQNRVFFGFALSVAFTTCQVLALPGCLFMAIAAGHFYGLPTGLALTVLLSIMGSALCFLFMRSFRSCLPDKLQESTAWLRDKVQRSSGSPCWILLSGRLFPLVPPSVFNTVCSLAEVPFLPFLLATSLASVPQSAVSVQAGATLAQLEQFGMTWDSFLLMLALCLLSVLPLLLKRGQDHQPDDDSEAEEQQSLDQLAA